MVVSPKIDIVQPCIKKPEIRIVLGPGLGLECSHATDPNIAARRVNMKMLTINIKDVPHYQMTKSANSRLHLNISPYSVRFLVYLNRDHHW